MFEHLSWDSDFFNFKIAKISVDAQMSESEFSKTINYLKENSYRLAYVFINENDYKLNAFNYLDNSKLVDRKITFIKQITWDDFDDDVNQLQNIKSALFEKLNDEILNIAYQTGEYSRFNIDTKFPTGSYKRLYQEWIHKSINKIIADDVYVFNNEKNKNIGLVTLKSQNEIGIIGLIGVGENQRGSGVGSKLIKVCQNYLLNHNVGIIEVATQQDNKDACNFYLKNLFKIKQIENIYHYWL